jgi:hypothetical protein
VARYADACNLFAPEPSVVAHKLGVLDRHCDAEGRDPADIARTIIFGSDPLVDMDAFLSDMTEYAALGIGQVWVSPFGPDPARWVEQVCEQFVPRLADL